MNLEIRFTPASIAVLTAFLLAALIIGMTALGPNNRAVSLSGEVLYHNGQEVLKPDQEVGIVINGLAKLAAPAALDIWAHGGAGLRLMPGTAQPAEVTAERVRWFFTGPVPDRLGLANYSKRVIKPIRIRARNYLARNTGTPRFAVLIPGSEHTGTHWAPWRRPLLIAAAMLALFIGAVPWLRRGGELSDPRFWALSTLPALGLASTTLIALAGYRLLLAYDAYLLLFGLGPLLILVCGVGIVARWLERRIAALAAVITRSRLWTALRDLSLPGYVMLPLVAAIIFVPAMLMPSPPLKVPFDSDWLQELNKNKPYVVAIGNSMIGSRIDVKKLSELLGKPVDIKWSPGSGPRLWYLLFKNYVCQAETKPKYVVLMYADYEFPWPRQGWLNEWDIREVERLTPDKYQQYDPVFKDLCLADPTFRQKLQLLIRRWFNVSNYAFPAKQWLDTLIMDITEPPLWVQQTEPSWQTPFWKNFVNERFALDHLRAGVYVPRQKQPSKNFHEARQAIDKSFLPHFIKLAKENGIELILLRMQHRIFNSAHNGQEPKDMRMVVETQKKYLDEQGIKHYDFKGDPEITEELYGAGDHIGFDHRRTRWTEIMFKRMGKMFK